MFDIKSFFKREVEKKLIDVDDYIFMPERIQMELSDGLLNCVLDKRWSSGYFLYQTWDY